MDVFALTGDWSVGPASGNPRASDVIGALAETLYVDRSDGGGKYTLIADAPVSVGFGSLSQANVVIIATENGKIRVRLTSADGSSQSIPVDRLLVLVTESVPVTAIDLTRVVGVETIVSVFLAQRAT